MKSIHINDIPSINSKNSRLIRKKRERLVFQNDNFYYKIWVPDWSSGDVTKYAFDSGYYDKENTACITSLIHDETGQRGYVSEACANFKNPKNNWSELINTVDKKECKRFIVLLLKRSLVSKGVYTDLCPGNIVVTKNKKISLIDLESFSSFKLIFEKSKEDYEKFSLDAKWRPAETARRDFNEFYKSYIKQCLGIHLDYNLDSIESIEKTLRIIQ